jgi:hypothetical protein
LPCDIGVPKLVIFNLEQCDVAIMSFIGEGVGSAIAPIMVFPPAVTSAIAAIIVAIVMVFAIMVAVVVAVVVRIVVPVRRVAIVAA